MTYKPRLHHFARLLVSVAVGLSFTGCGNSSNSSDGGSTGPTLIDKGYKCAYFKGTPDQGVTNFEIVLQPNGTLGIFLYTNNPAKGDLFTGAWSATQLPNNTYQIALTDTELENSTCKITFDDPLLTLTIPEGKLKAYREGREVTGVTLKVNATHAHKGGASCPMNQSGSWYAGSTAMGRIQQSTTIPSFMP